VELRVDKLVCRRAGRLVFADVSFALSAGEALAVRGRNGAGKSTLLAALAGRLAPASGRVSAGGIGERILAECLHHVGHRDGLKSALTSRENLAFALALLGRPWLAPIHALERVGLGGAADLPVGYLSAGQRRRVALARLLVVRRPLWLLDEPGAALDAASQGLLLTLMQDHLAAGGLLIAATHAPLGLADAKELRIGPNEDSGPSAHRGDGR
jgi:heme exporter protein A